MTKLKFIFKDHLINYSTPATISYSWSFGFLSGICLFIQILTGILLSFHYVPDINYAFLSIIHIMENVQYGWFLKYAHANTASFFLLCCMHICFEVYIIHLI